MLIFATNNSVQRIIAVVMYHLSRHINRRTGTSVVNPANMCSTHKVLVDRDPKEYTITDIQLLSLVELHVVKVKEQITCRLNTTDGSNPPIVLMDPLDTTQHIALGKCRGVIVVVIHEFLGRFHLTHHHLIIENRVERCAGNRGAGARARSRLPCGVKDNGRRRS